MLIIGPDFTAETVLFLTTILRSEIIADRAIVHAETGASNDGYPKVRKDFTITEKAPTRAFSWSFKTLLRYYAKQALTSRQVGVKLSLQRNYYKGRAAL